MRKKGIFLKIYLCFWIATALIIGTQVTLDRLAGVGPPMEHMPHFLTSTLALYGEMILKSRQGDEAGSRDSLEERLRSETGVKALVVDETGREINNRSLSPEVGALSFRAMQSHRPERDFVEGVLMTAVVIEGPDGMPYAVIGELPREQFGPPPPFAAMGFTRLLVVLLISAGVCYLFARMLTAPVVKIREATRRFADGELNVRIGGQVGKGKDELSDLANDFDRMAERIESLLTLQRQLLADISHELRSPLARLNVALELARRQKGHEGEKALNRIEREAGSLNTMIDQLLTLTRLEEGGGEIMMTFVDLDRLVAEVVKDGDFEAKGSQRGVKITTNEECVIVGNRELLHRGIENVIRNAIRYTPEGTQVEVMLRQETCSSGQQAVISVRDHGPGVKTEELVNLFRPFYRVSSARERQTGGVGLGLAITERAVLKHRGIVQVHNAPEGGLIVEIVLPVEPSDQNKDLKD